MINKDILATNGFLTLLHNNKAKKIGEIRNSKYYIYTNSFDIETSLVSFDYSQNGNEDLFFFNNDVLVFHVMCEDSYKNRNWLYKSLMPFSKPISKSELIETLVEIYTAKEIGF